MAAAACESRGRIFFNLLIYFVMIKLIQDGKPVNIPEEQDIPSKKSDPTLDNLNTNMSPLEMLEQIVKNRQSMNYSDKDRDDAYFNNYIQLLIRDEDFKRSSPHEQVSRLMAAGMSRSAALAALQGQEYGSANTGIAGNVESNATERMNAVNSIVQNAAQLTQQIFELGCQIAIAPSAIMQARDTAKLTHMQAFNMSQQIDASQGVGMILQGMSNWHEQTGLDYADSLDSMIDIMRKSDPQLLPDVVSSANAYDRLLKNPYFYPMMKSSYRRIYMDKNDLYNEARRDNASANLADIDLEKACLDVAKYNSELNVQLATEEAQISTILSGAKIASSQASMAEDDAILKHLDTEFWSQFDGKVRFNYLNDMTRSQAYDTALKKLNVELQEQINENTLYELTNELKALQKLGPEYFDSKASELMKNSQYRNTVLQLGLITSQSSLEHRLKTDALNEVTGPLGFISKEVRSLSDYFRSMGVLDKAITEGAKMLGFFAK